MSDMGYVAIFVGLLTVLSLAYSRKRARDVRAFATQEGFTYLAALPDTLALADTAIASVTKVWNVIDGHHKGVRIIAFDCRIGSGKGSWRRTVIAAKMTRTMSAGMASYDLRLESAGEWTIAYRPLVPSLLPGFMPVSELAPRIESLVGQVFHPVR